MKGYMMTSIAIALLSGMNAKWRSKGVFWRAGITAAALKFFSPSHKIINPAIAITCEGFLMELGQRLFGSNIVGFAVGGSMAMFYTLVHKFSRMMLTYGTDIYLLYAAFFQKTALITGLEGLTPLNGLIFLSLIYLLWGVLAASVGFLIGCSAKDTRPDILYLKEVPVVDEHRMKDDKNLPEHSFFWLFFCFAGALLTLVFMSKNSFIIPLIFILSIYASVRYRVMLRKLLRVKFWFPVLVISFLSGVILYSTGGDYLSFGAFAGGVRMIFRVYFMTLFITGLTYEFSHPYVKGIIASRYGDTLETALQTAGVTRSAVQPYFSGRTAFQSPVKTFRSVISTAHSVAEKRFSDVVIITGGVDSGKTSFMKKEWERLSGFGVCGFCAFAERLLPSKDHYYIKDLNSSRSELFCYRNSEGKFIFRDDALEFGRNVVVKNIENSRYVFLDEAGKLEINGGGWCGLIKEVLRADVTLVVSVRRKFLDEFIEAFDIERPVVVDVEKAG
jgi:nucleoside-triphosphatase THEP1